MPSFKLHFQLISSNYLLNLIRLTPDSIISSVIAIIVIADYLPIQII